jgi:CrcB protein
MADKARKESGRKTMETLKAYGLVGLGSAFGGMARYWVSGIVADWIGQNFPWGTIVINITGSLLIGVFYSLTLPEGRMNTSRILVSQLVMYGICGGYTTFSSFSLRTLTLAQEGQWLLAGGNIVISVVACLIAVWLGFLIGQLLNG